MIKKLLLFSLTLVLAFMISPVQASTLSGHTVNVTHYFPSLSNVDINMGNQVVPTAEFVYYDIYQYQVFDNYLTWNVHCGSGCSWIGTDFNGPVLSVLTSGFVFTSASIDASSSYSGFTASRLTYDASHIYINAQDLDANGYLKVNFSSDQVPEPAFLLLLGTGLGATGLATWRRRK